MGVTLATGRLKNGPFGSATPKHLSKIAPVDGLRSKVKLAPDEVYELIEHFSTSRFLRVR